MDLTKWLYGFDIPLGEKGDKILLILQKKREKVLATLLPLKSLCFNDPSAKGIQNFGFAFPPLSLITPGAGPWTINRRASFNCFNINGMGARKSPCATCVPQIPASNNTPLMGPKVPGNYPESAWKLPRNSKKLERRTP